MELLVVIGIIGILVLISLPNISKIIMMNRFRSSANDMLIRSRFVRDLALKTRRQLNLVITPANQSGSIQKPAYTEYDLLQNIAEAIRKSETITDKYILYEEKGGKVCLAHWNEYAVPPGNTCEYYLAGIKPNNAVDDFSTTCPLNRVSFNPSGTFEDTCAITVKNNTLKRQYTLTLYKGGQTMLTTSAF